MGKAARSPVGSQVGGWGLGSSAATSPQQFGSQIEIEIENQKKKSILSILSQPMDQKPALLRQSTLPGGPPTILQAIQVIEDEAKRRRAGGLSTLSFFVGITNLLASAYLLGAKPEAFWLVYACQAFMILGYRLAHTYTGGFSTKGADVNKMRESSPQMITTVCAPGPCR